ncbi:hypothetical protein J8F10_24815 [Gemmata sp. G18]|uniref:Energy transducer TonB n=1 Tax=Gemmata palustris TaxID=2822762 RepID=A0ABS5C007_9BACT|nr:hypothetical protein [Gemmata palustris]MBP3958483.1 hypothetical protein [Gemmata palustris]
MNTSTPNHPPNAPDPLAVALAKLDPAPHGFEWNALMFAAGRESKARALAFWRTTSGVLAVIAGGFAFAFFARSPVVVERQNTVYVDRVAPTPTGVPAAPAPRPLPEIPPPPR